LSEEKEEHIGFFPCELSIAFFIENSENAQEY
jgi:hypothetical protein